jgi:PAS domain-containing protein
MSLDLCQVALSIVNQMHAMVAYWTADERCTFSNRAYQRWFDKSPEEMAKISLQELLGSSVYELNNTHIQGALRGEKQVFERHLTGSSGATQRFLATYTPDVVEDVVLGFSAHVTELPSQIRLREWLPICANCKDIRTATGEWHPIEEYLWQYSAITFTHGLCPKCMPHYFPSANAEMKPS